MTWDISPVRASLSPAYNAAGAAIMAGRTGRQTGAPGTPLSKLTGKGRHANHCLLQPERGRR